MKKIKACVNVNESMKMSRTNVIMCAAEGDPPLIITGHRIHKTGTLHNSPNLGVYLEWLYVIFEFRSRNKRGGKESTHRRFERKCCVAGIQSVDF